MIKLHIVENKYLYRELTSHFFLLCKYCFLKNLTFDKNLKYDLGFVFIVYSLYTFFQNVKLSM